MFKIYKYAIVFLLLVATFLMTISSCCPASVPDNQQPVEVVSALASASAFSSALTAFTTSVLEWP